MKHSVTKTGKKNLELFTLIIMKILEVLIRQNAGLFCELANVALAELEADGHCKYDLKKSLQTAVAMSKNFDVKNKKGRVQ
jgi:hypothetical protein